MAVEVTAGDESGEPVDTERWARLAGDVLEAEGVEGPAELSLLFVDEKVMAELNGRFLGSQRPTDVLAFPLDEPGAPAAAITGAAPGAGGGPADGGGAPRLLGDVVVCPAVARRNAVEHERSHDDEIALLVVHGVLHVLGMDHAGDEEAAAMQGRERELLARFQVPRLMP